MAQQRRNSAQLDSGTMGTSDVCPTEDAIQTLLEHLVDPLLPAKSPVRDNPSESQQQLVAAQVHAVMLLYNYYHRKQHPHLKEWDFQWFCKFLVANKPVLLAYMNFMQKSDDAKSKDLVKQFSITENQILDAYDISKSLYALKGAPSTDWPISKVTVFLIDSLRKNCLLQLNSVTQGVWSVIEKKLGAANQSSEGAMAAKKLNKKKAHKNASRDELSSNEVDFQQLAFSAVEEATKISQTDLTILEGHVTYSLSEEKSSTCFYIMQCTLSKYDGIFPVPIKDAIDSLQGPLLQKSSLGWMVSAVVEYFHMLPYAAILSDWQSGIVSSNSFYSAVGLGNVNINDYKKSKNTCNIVQKDTCGFPGDSVMKEVIDNKTVCAYTVSPENKDENDDFMSDSSDASDRLEPDHMDVDKSEIGINTKGRMVESATRLSVTQGEREEATVGGKICNIKTSDHMQVHKADPAPLSHQSDPIECRSEKVAVGKKTCNIKTSDQAQMHKADSALAGHQPKPAECRSEKVDFGTKIGTSDQFQRHKADPALLSHKPNPKDLDKPQTDKVLTKTSNQGQMHKVDSDLVCHQPRPKYLDKPPTIEASKTCNIKTSHQGRMHKVDSDLVCHHPNPKVLDKPHTIEVSETCNIKTSDQAQIHKADSALAGHQPKPAKCRSEKVAAGNKFLKIGASDQVQMHKADSALASQPKPAECRSEKVAVGNKLLKTGASDQVQMHKADSALVGHKPNPKDLDKPQTNKVLTKTFDQGRMHKADSDLVCHQPNPKVLDKPQTIEASKTCNIKTSAQGRMHKADSDLVCRFPDPKVLDKPQTIEVSETCNIKTDQAQMHTADSALAGHQPKPAECRSEEVAAGNKFLKIGASDQVKMHKADSALVGHKPSPKDLGKPQTNKVLTKTSDQDQGRMHKADSDLVCHHPNPKDLGKPQTNKVLTKTSDQDQGRMHKADSDLVCHHPNPKVLDKPQTIEVLETCNIKTSDQAQMHIADSALAGHQPKSVECRRKKVAVGNKFLKIGASDQVQMHNARSSLAVHQAKPAECRSEMVAVGNKFLKIGASDQVQIHKADSALVGHKPSTKDLDTPQTSKVLTKTSDQGQMHKADSDLVCHQPNPKDLDKPQTIEVLKEDVLSQIALKVHLRKRDKLTLELRSIEDEIAQCDRSIQRILNGSKEDFALKIASIIEGHCCTDVCSRIGIRERTYEPTEEQGIRYIKRKRLSEAVLSVQNPCEELDGVCYENNWILPTYRLSSSDGGFEAKASVKGIDFECSSEGCLCSSPREARESAAAQMLTKLRSLAKSNPTY